MTKFKLENKEEVLANYQNVLVFANDADYYLDVFITNKRLVLLTDINKYFDYINTFRDKGQAIPAEYEMVLDLKKEKIKSISYIDEYNHITLNDKDDTLDIYTESIEKYFE